MTAQITQAVYQMSLEPGGYERGVQQVAQANQKLVQSTEQVVVAEEKVTRATRTTADGFAKLEARYDPLIRAEQRRQAAIAQATRYLDEGTVTQARYEAQVQRINAAYGQQAAAMQRMAVSNDNLRAGLVQGTVGAGRFGGAIQQAGYQVGDFAVQVASGQGVLRPFIQQGTQLISMFGPWGAVIGAAGAVVGALAMALGGLEDSTDKAATAQRNLDSNIGNVTKLLQEQRDMGKNLGDAHDAEIKRLREQAKYWNSLTAEVKAYQEARLTGERLSLERNIAEQTRSVDPVIGQAESAVLATRNAMRERDRIMALIGSEGSSPSREASVEAFARRINEQQLGLVKALDQLKLSGGGLAALREFRVEVTRLEQTGGPFAESLGRIREALAGPLDNIEKAKAAIDKLNESLVSAAKPAAQRAVDAEGQTNEELTKSTKAYADEINRALDLRQEELKAMGQQVVAQTAAERAEIKRNQDLEAYITGLEQAATLDGQSKVDKDVQAALIEAQNKLLDEQGEIQERLKDSDRARIETAVRQREAFDRQRQESEKYLRDYERTVDRTLDNISRAGADILFDAWEGEGQNFWETFERFGKRTLANLAAEQLTQTFARPLVSGAVNMLPGLFGLSAPAGGGGAQQGQSGGFLGGLFGSSSPASLLSNGSSFLGMNFSSGASMLATNPLANMGYAANGIAGALGIGGGIAATQGAAAAYGISAGQAAVLANSGALGAAGALSPLAATGIGAAIAIAAIVAMSMMGGKKSVGPNATAGLSYVDGLYTVGNRGADNGGDLGAVVNAAQQAADALNQLQTQFGIRPRVDTANIWNPVVGDNGGAFGLGTGLYGSGEAMIIAMAQKGALTSDSETMNTVLRGTKAKTSEEFAADLAFAQLYDSLTVLKEPANDLVEAMEEVRKQLADASDKARDFGLDVDKLNEGFRRNFDQDIERQIRALTDPLGLALEDFDRGAELRLETARELGANLVEVERLTALQRVQILEQAAASTTNSLRAWLDAQIIGPTSGLTGSGRLAEAQAQFGSAVDAARTGTGGIGRVTELADVIAGLNKDLYGGSAQGAALEAMLRSTVESLGRDLGLPGFANGGDFMVGGAGGTDSQIVAFRATPGESVHINPPGQGSGIPAEAVRSLVRSNARMSAEMAAMRQDLAQATEALVRTQKQQVMLLHAGAGRR